MTGDCNFENGMCNWVNARTGDHFDWTIRSGSTPSSLTGPSSDRHGNVTGVVFFHCSASQSILITVTFLFPCTSLIPNRNVLLCSNHTYRQQVVSLYSCFFNRKPWQTRKHTTVHTCT